MSILIYKVSRKSIFEKKKHTIKDFYDKIRGMVGNNKKENGITEYFEDVETIKEYSGYMYSVSEAITIVILGSMSKCENVSQIHQWSEDERVRKLLKEKFGIENVPCYYWLLTLMNMVKPEALNRCFWKWVSSITGEEIAGNTIAVDGKTVRSTERMTEYERPLHIVSAYISELGMTFAQKAVEGKSSEMPAVRDLLEELEIRGCVIVADALNCQKKTAETIVKKGAEYILCVKDNQSNLRKDIEDYVADKRLRSGMKKASEEEVQGGRIEKRTVYATNDIDWLEQKEKWAGLKSIVAVKREVEKKKSGESNCEWHYYISSMDTSAGDFLHRIRMEWGVEAMHWLLDVHFREDFCRIENRNAQQNLNMLRKAALNLMKQYKTKTQSKLALSKLMFKCLLDPNFILKILNL